MRTRDLIRVVAGVVLLLPAIPGCMSLYRGRSCPVLVRDAETKAPIPGAEVRLSDTAAHPPKITAATSGDDGVARLKVTPSAEFAYAVSVSAGGYLSDEKDLAVSAVRELPAGWLGPPRDVPPALVVELFSGPRPTVELVVPVGYRGVVRVDLGAREDGTDPPGRRMFTFAVPSDGVVKAVGPPVLLHGLLPEFRAHYADGTPLSRDARDNEVGFRWVQSSGHEQIFMVGTRPEWEEYRRSVEKSEPSGRSGGRGGSGGGGGHHRGGGGMGGGRMGGGR